MNGSPIVIKKCCAKTRKKGNLKRENSIQNAMNHRQIYYIRGYEKSNLKN